MTSAIGPTGRRILITGGGGFLGARLARAAHARGDDVHLTIRPHGDRHRIAELERSTPSVTVHEVDLTDLQATQLLLMAIEPADVIHSAARGGHAAEAVERIALWADNVMATIALLVALDPAVGCRLVHVGSSLEYEPSDLPLREDDPCRPTTVRGASKLAATTAVRQWAAEKDRPVCVVRPFSIYGPGEPPGRLMPTLVRCATEDQPFDVIEGVSRRDLVHVDDVAEGCLRALEVADEQAPILNIGTGKEYTIRESVQMVESVSGKRIRVVESARERQRHDVEHWLADTSKLASALGWLPTTSLADGLRTMLPAEPDHTTRRT